MAPRKPHSDHKDSPEDPSHESSVHNAAPPEKVPIEPTSSATGKRAEANPQDAPQSASSGINRRNFDTASPQLHAPNRVQKSMATLALDPLKPSGRQMKRTDAVRPRKANAAELDDDSAAMLRVRNGDDLAFHRLVEKYHRPMMHYMYRMTHNQAVAEELTQELFLRVYRSRESYRAEARFSTWLYRIATNLGVNYARDTRRERTAHTVYLDEPDPKTGTTPDVADNQPSAEYAMVREERMQAIRKHVMALPTRQRNAVLMHKYQGLNYRQIGEVLNLSESATKSLLFRAYQTLRERLKGFVEEN